MRVFAILSLAAAAALSGCATPDAGPRTAAQAGVPAAFGGDRAAAPAGELAAWWTAFDDPVLTSLVSRALAANLDVRQAALRVREARLQQRIVHGGQGPQANASTSAAANHLSRNALPSSLANLFSGSSGSGGGLGLPGETIRTYQAGFDASWELDLFGGDAHADEAARARADAALWSRRDAEVVLAAEVANTWLQTRSLRRRLALADQALATRRELLDVAQVRQRHGLADDGEVLRQRQSVQQASAQREDLQAQAEAGLHALASLLGLAPRALAGELPPSDDRPPARVDVPPGLPSELLERRPDIRAAQRQAAATAADVGVAKADLYPHISLTGALQLASRSLSSLVDADSRQGSLAGKVAFPLLGRDRLHATVGLRQAQADEAALAYRAVVLHALRDVEDALTRLEADRRREGDLREAARAAREAADSAGVGYRQGLVAASAMLSARQGLQAAEDAALQSQAASEQDVVALYKALGGGWDARRYPEEQEDSRDR
ncbi:MAG: efflux transporter outer membrane subunit [Burkholderiales bacterium]|nr:efflux transporter outer membrane subunit [Burkholderiales bacterium]